MHKRRVRARCQGEPQWNRVFCTWQGHSSPEQTSAVVACIRSKSQQGVEQVLPRPHPEVDSCWERKSQCRSRVCLCSGWWPYIHVHTCRTNLTHWVIKQKQKRIKLSCEKEVVQEESRKSQEGNGDGYNQNILYICLKFLNKQKTINVSTKLLSPPKYFIIKIPPFFLSILFNVTWYVSISPEILRHWPEKFFNVSFFKSVNRCSRRITHWAPCWVPFLD